MCWGRNTNGQIGKGNTVDQYSPLDVPGLTNVQTVSVDNNQTCAVTNTHTYCWGLNTDGQLGVGNFVNRTSPTQVTGF